MKVQITIKTGKETETYKIEVEYLQDFVSDVDSMCDNDECLNFKDLNKGHIIIGQEVLRNSIIEFKKIKD